MFRFLRRHHSSPGISPIARRVRDGRLTYLKDAKLVRIEQAIGDVSRSVVPGAFVECGVALGGSGTIGGDPYYGYIDNLYDRVVENFGRFGQPVDGRRVSLYKGFFEDTLQPQTDIAFAHIDCDWYDPVKRCLERIVPRLSPGAYVVLDDYNDYGGCRRAEFLEAGPDVDVIAREVAGPHFRKDSPWI